MMKLTQITTLKGLVTAIAALGIIAVPVVQADDTRTDSKPEAYLEWLEPKVTTAFVEGYTVPNQYRIYFREIPAIEGENVVMRYHRGRAYYVGDKDWIIVRIVNLNPTVEVKSEDEVFVEGYVIPENTRNRFDEVPTPGANLAVRYYNGTAYFMDSSYLIVRTERLKP